MEKNAVTAKKLGTRQIAVVGMLSAVSTALGLSGYGFIPLPMAKATIMHIPVIIGAILEGPFVGAMIGLIFGLFSLLQSIIAPTSVLSFAFINPLVSIIPRILIGLMSYYSYRLIFGRISDRFESVRIGLGAALGSLTNTIGVLGTIYILYAERFNEILDKTGKGAVKVILGIAATNGIPEAIIAVIITIPVVLSVRRLKR